MDDNKLSDPPHPDLAVLRSRSYLPHWERDDAAYFVTFRLADALPQQVLLHYQAEREALLVRAQIKGQPLSIEEKDHLELLVSRRIQRYLDTGMGACHLATPDVAEVVKHALGHFDGIRYRLFAWCIMPNHVHVVVQPLAPYTLSEILHSWKSFTANRVQRLFGFQGAFWQREYYDHLIRNEGVFWRIIKYVKENPAKVNLQDWQWVYVCIPEEFAL
ncbi:MAG TPA: transposase [Ktedonobacterales bacterium]|nr:transposase [Ktedonobacterales bacterium]